MKTYTKLLNAFVILFGFSQSLFAQCGDEIDIIICDMVNIDFDGDANNDGVINLYDEYTKATGQTLDPGIWSVVDNSLSFPLDASTGNVSLWDYKFTSASNLADYVFELTNTLCGTTIAATINLELGPHSGVALPASGTNNVNLEVCEGNINLFEALVSNEIIPAPHINGLWEVVGELPNNLTSFFLSPSTGNLTTEIEYQQGLPLVDKAIIAFKYVVGNTENCAAQETNIILSVVRQVDSGVPINILICEDEILEGNFNDDIDLTDNNYLLGEDVEGFWSSSDNDYTTEISDVLDSTVNIKNLYDALIIEKGLQFGNETFVFTYSVPQRSGVCVDKNSAINVIVYEELRPFKQNDNNAQFCLNETSSVNLYDFIEFTNESGVDFIYPNAHESFFVNWAYISGPENLVERTSLDAVSFFQNGDYLTPGVYTFSYSVDSEVNGIESTCDDLSTSITFEILPFDYAGEDTTNVEVCENEETITLTNLLNINSLKAPVITTGVWTDIDGVIYDNNFIFPEIDEDTTYNLIYNTINAASGCTDSANLTFTILNETSPGSTGESITTDGIVKICTDDLSIILFDQLQNADTIGQWTGPNGYVSADYTGTFVFNDQTQQDIVEGEYVYTIGNGENCTSIETTTIIIEFVEPITLGSKISRFFCKTGNQVDLLSLLAVTAPVNGTFSAIETHTALSGSILDLSLLDGGFYNFTYEIDNTPCDNPVQEIMIEVIDDQIPPSAGIAPTETVKICADDLTVTLFEQLDGSPSISGIWSGPFTYQSNDHLGLFEQDNQNLPILGPGEYIYTVGGGICNTPIDTATLTIEIIEPIQLGDNIFASFCKLDGGLNLFSLLDEDTSATGQFFDIESTDVLSTDGFVDFSNLAGGVYNFQYSIPNEEPCDFSSLNIEINLFEVEIPKVDEIEFCILEAKGLDDVFVTDQLGAELSSTEYNWYVTLQSEDTVTSDPTLIDGDVFYVTRIDAENCESERLQVTFSILNIGEISTIENSSVQCTLDFQDGVSPDGNGKYDTFSMEIENGNTIFNLAEAFPDFELEMYNRFGTVVYKANSNTSEFNGTSNVSLSIGKDLPSGVYYYIFNPNFKNNTPIQGSFYLSK